MKFSFWSLACLRSWDSIVSIVTRLRAGWQRNYVLILGRSSRYFCSPNHPDQPSGSLILLGLYPLGQIGQGANLTLPSDAVDVNTVWICACLCGMIANLYTETTVHFWFFLLCSEMHFRYRIWLFWHFKTISFKERVLFKLGCVF
jgi:hypothetical protein